MRLYPHYNGSHTLCALITSQKKISMKLTLVYVLLLFYYPPIHLRYFPSSRCQNSKM